MRNEILKFGKTALPFLTAMIFFFLSANGQQSVINNKDNTHPEIETYSTRPAFISFFRAIRENGYNEIAWNGMSENDTRKYIVEYSVNGVDYSSAGELIAGQNSYELKHYTFDDRPTLYRLRTEQLNGKSFYSEPIFLRGIPVEPVFIYPTIVDAQVVNVNAAWPVERIVVTAANGQQVLTKQMGGVSGKMTVNVSFSGKGAYWMTFYGNGWKSTSKFILP